MKRLLAVALLVLAGCGSSGASGDAPAAAWKPPADVSKLDHRTISGADVWVDKTNRMIYTEDCEKARTLTASGEFGTSGGPGYGYICR